MGYALFMPKPIVYLDNCVYNRPFDDQTQIRISLEAEAKRYIQRLITEKHIDLIYSYVNRLENDDNPYKARKKSIASFFAHAMRYIDHTHAQTIEERAAGIMETGIKAKDALHISCAIEGGCSYFITTDKPLMRYLSPHIIFCGPVEFLDFLEGIYNA